MGKYPDSVLLNKYSKWHWDNCGHKSLMTDADVTLVSLPDVYRLWYEVREVINKAAPVAVIDIKNEQDRKPTYTEEVVYDWHLEKGLKVYIVNTDLSLSHFEITRWQDKKKMDMDAERYIEWIKKLKNT